MMVIMVSKWVGDLFNISLYDIHVELKCIPFVESSAPAHHSLLKVSCTRVRHWPCQKTECLHCIHRLVTS